MLLLMLEADEDGSREGCTNNTDCLADGVVGNGSWKVLGPEASNGVGHR